MTTKIIYRDCCRICKAKNLIQTLSLSEMPFTDEFVIKESLGSEFKSDIKIYLCTDCQTVQTQHDVDVRSYYEDYQYSVGKSKMATVFMESLANAVVDKYFQNNKKDNIKVLEIGSGDGSQLIPFKQLGCRVLGYEPSSYLSQTSESQGIPTIQGLFDKSSVDLLPKDFQTVDIVLLSYTFDHLPEPREFIEAVTKIIDPDRGILVIEIHDLEKIFERREYCLFEHEHSIYLTTSTAQSLMEREGYSIIDLDIIPESIRRANSLLFISTRNSSILAGLKVPRVQMPQFEDFYFYEAQIEKIYKGIENLEEYVESRVKRGKKIAGYGAGGRGVMTLAAMNNGHKLEYLVDQKPKGAGLFCPKTGIPIFGLEKLENDPVDEVIVFSFGYMQEIKHDLMNMGYQESQIYSMIDVLQGEVS
jgi:2-polyprenyl-3-methyl-5-hydroxy-6-metoxy-1,4-benzoquinol methylase